jgi:hypothetical protein
MTLRRYHMQCHMPKAHISASTYIFPACSNRLNAIDKVYLVYPALRISFCFGPFCFLATKSSQSLLRWCVFGLLLSSISSCYFTRSQYMKKLTFSTLPLILTMADPDSDTSANSGTVGRDLKAIAERGRRRRRSKDPSDSEEESEEEMESPPLWRSPRHGVVVAHARGLPLQGKTPHREPTPSRRRQSLRKQATDPPGAADPPMDSPVVIPFQLNFQEFPPQEEIAAAATVAVAAASATVPAAVPTAVAEGSPVFVATSEGVTTRKRKKASPTAATTARQQKNKG